MLHDLMRTWFEFTKEGGYPGVFLMMALESTIVPIPSEIIIPPAAYYAAQGNATRLFFRGEAPSWPAGWNVFHREAFSAFHYVLCGGFSKPALYPAGLLGPLRRLDAVLSVCPRLFAARCLVGLSPAA